MIKTLITPLHRPEDVYNSHENVMRQGPEWTWIIVEDHGRNLCLDQGIKPHVILHSKPHVSHARNTALDYLRNLQGGPHLWVNFDGDDYYGPDYANRKACALQMGGVRIADVSTASALFVHLESGELLQCPTPGPMGSTLAGWSDCKDYPIGPNEDGAWLELMRKCNAIDSKTGSIGHIYRRTGRGVWKVSDQKIISDFRLRTTSAPLWSYGIRSEAQAREIAANEFAIQRKAVPLSVVFV